MTGGKRAEGRLDQKGGCFDRPGTLVCGGSSES